MCKLWALAVFHPSSPAPQYWLRIDAYGAPMLHWERRRNAPERFRVFNGSPRFSFVAYPFVTGTAFQADGPPRLANQNALAEQTVSIHCGLVARQSHDWSTLRRQNTTRQFPSNSSSTCRSISDVSIQIGQKFYLLPHSFPNLIVKNLRKMFCICQSKNKSDLLFFLD